jgi:PAS domain S-box-containing protein
VLRFLNGGGALGELIRAHDWSSTPLGRFETWPMPLRHSLSICLSSAFPTAIYWGRELRLLYNDAWATIPAERHPWALGRPAAEVWADIWPIVGPQLQGVLDRGEGFTAFDQMLPMQRDGLIEESYWNYSFTPIRSENGDVVGVFNQGNETTERVLGQRLQEFRLELERRLRELEDPDAMLAHAAEKLRGFLGANRVGYTEIQPDGETVRPTIGVAEGVEPLAGTFRLADFGPANIARLREGKSQWSDDLAADPRYDPAVWAAIRTRAYASVPVLRHGELTGTLYVNFSRPHRWKAHEIALIEDVAARIREAGDRARAEAERRESEARFRALATAGSYAIYRMSPNWQELRQLDGRGFLIDRPDPSTDWLEDYVPAAELPRGREAIESAIAGKTAFDLEHQVLKADGSLGWTHSRAVPVLNREGVITEWFGAATDVTQRREADLKFRESEARFRNLADHAPVMMWVTDPTGYCTYLNRAWYEFTGQSESEAEGYGWIDAVHPDDRPAAKSGFLDSNANRAPFRLEYRLRRHDGSYRWAIDAAAPRFSDSGEHLGYVGSVIDIDARREIEERLRLSEERLRIATQAAAIGTFDYDLEQDALRWDERCRELFGLSPEMQVDYALFLETLHPDDREPTHLAVKAALDPAGSGFYSVEYRARPLDGGDERWIAANGQALFRGDGARRKAVRFVGTVLDITPSKRAEEILERRVEQRTSELESVNRQLLQQIEERERVEATLQQMQRLEAVGQLTSGVAHDFNNLLTIVLGNIRFIERALLKGEIDQKVLDRLANMRMAADRGAALTTQLLAFSRRQRLEAKTVDLNETVAGMGSLLQSSIGGAIEIVIDFAEDLWPAFVDPTQVELAILNLAINARDAMRGGGRLTVSTGNVVRKAPMRPEEPPAGDYAMVAVSDTGTGMSEEVLAKAFEPFFTTKEVGKGSGLGLAQIYGFAKQSGGGVSIETKEGVGTTVRVFFPRARQAEAQERPPCGQIDLSALAKARVLLVDDDPQVRDVTGTILRELGCDPVEAGSGADALALLADVDGDFDIAVLDFAMPGMDGGELARRIGEHWSALPILFLTGYADTRALGEVADDRILQKPVAPDLLAAKLAALIGARSPRQAVSAAMVAQEDSSAQR